MNDIIKLILFNLLLFWILKYDKRYSTPIIVVMIIYWITIQSSIRTKIVEGNSFFEDFVKLPEFSNYENFQHMIIQLLYLIQYYIIHKTKDIQVYSHSLMVVVNTVHLRMIECLHLKKQIVF